MGKLVIDDLTKVFGPVTAVKQVSLTVGDGELVSVVGPSGCGKTTLLRMIAGFTEPTSGRIMIDGDVLFDSAGMTPPLPPEKRDIGMVFQSYAVWPHMNVFRNVAYPLRIRRLDRKAIADKVGEALRLVHLTGFEKRMAYEMSGGQQQRVALARALVMEPRLLLLDEPFSNLDAKLSAEMCGELLEIRKKTGITIVHVTHDQAEAMSVSDRVAVMRDGVLLQYDTPRNVYGAPANTFTASFIGEANIFPAERTGREADGKMEVRLPGGRKILVPFREGKKEGFVLVRPGGFVPASDGGEAFPVKEIRFFGDSVRYELEGGELGTLHMSAPPDAPYKEGESVPLRIRDALWLDS